jgi:hypothetical protein
MEEVVMSTETMFLALPQLTAGALMGLDDDARFVALDLAEIMRGAFSAANPRAYLLEAAQTNSHRGRGWSFKRLESRYYAIRNGADPADVLVNKAKECGNKSRWMTPAVVEAWRVYCARHFRSYKSAWLELAADYRVGKKVGDVDWRAVWAEHHELRLDPIPLQCPRGMPLPEGWSYHNFMRHKPRQIEKLGARIGRMAARELARPVRTTRAEMEPGQQYVFDDVMHDNRVVVAGQLKSVRPMELACLDVASAYKVAFGLKPAREDALEQRRQMLRERDMRFLVAHVLCNVGFHPDGVTLFVENGTAAIREDMELVLNSLAMREDGSPLITVSRSGVDRETAHAGQWGAKAKGNFRSKSHLESWNNLSHNRLDDLPGQTGSNSRLNEPEETAALERATHKLLLSGMAMPPDLAKKLEMPVFDWQLFSDVLAERYAQIHATHDHFLEGWEHNTERQWRVSVTDTWHSEDSWQILTPEQRQRLEPIITQDGMTRVAKKSRWQVWRTGAAKLIRLPDYATALICGRDLAEGRPCPSMREITFLDNEISLRPLRYRLQSCIGANSALVDLVEGKMYRWMINPFDPRAIFVLDEGGAYVGKCDRVDVPNRLETEAAHKEMGKAKKDFDDALRPLALRGAGMARARIEELRRNTALLQAARPNELPRAEETAGGKNKAQEYDEEAVSAALAMIEQSME